MTHYSVEIVWSDEDEGFITTAPELPGCNAWGRTLAEVPREVEDAQAAWTKACMASGEPASARSTNGRLPA